jgi:dTDP-4-dehydrorhamnose 3,5-epimerase
MRASATDIPGVLLLDPVVYRDARGFFFESYNRRVLEAAGITGEFVQDNHSRSGRNVLRGLHYQIREPQGKLIRAVAGEVLDVVVDLRRSSPSFGRWTSFALSAENNRMAWIPPGFAHGFVVRSEFAEVLYKATAYWAPEHERTILWSDPDLRIDWQLDTAPILSAKDQQGALFRDTEVYP